MQIVQAYKANDIKIIEDLAYKIIPEFYSGIIPNEHNYFFVKKFQSANAILEQMKNGSEYYMLKIDNISIGYFGINIDTEKQLMVLSKLYILKEHRAKGYGTKSLNFIIRRANDLGIIKIVLTVNKENENSIRLYQKNGFAITNNLINKFENGFTVFDLEMTRINKHKNAL